MKSVVREYAGTVAIMVIFTTMVAQLAGASAGVAYLALLALVAAMVRWDKRNETRS
jgi:uncharacterized protein (DUF58 family)